MGLEPSGYARNAIVHAGRLDPGVELLTKPFTREALACKVREVIDKPGSERALLIFSSVLAADGARATLNGLGFATEIAGSAREALGKLRSAGGRFDCILLSDALPVGNLGAVIAELHSVRNDLPVLVLHADGAAGLKSEFAGKSCVGFVAQGSDADAFRSRLKQLRVSCANA